MLKKIDVNDYQTFNSIALQGHDDNLIKKFNNIF